MENLSAAIEFLGGPAAIWVLAGVYFGSVILERLWALRGKRAYNYGQVLIVWDRLFGTYVEVGEEPNAGLVKPTYDYNPLSAQFVGLQQLKARMDTADRRQDKLAYLWCPPEWSHDGVCRSDCPKYNLAELE
ncbi:sterol desaturase family protein, partial [Qipengyuania sp.]|uniref:sterol desaturase family protein n=1 Tax=Qipengyuania sp. TaxID=2004515 RepID=UPI0037353408